MNYILGIDPGPEASALAFYPLDAQWYPYCTTWGNESLLAMLPEPREKNQAHTWVSLLRHCQVAVIEMIASYGMPVGQEVFETCVVIGRLMEALRPFMSITRMTRKEVVLHLCHSPRAGDSNVRQALIDRYGGKAKAIGTTKTGYGPLHGVKNDMWSALAVAVTYAELCLRR